MLLLWIAIGFMWILLVIDTWVFKEANCELHISGDLYSTHCNGNAPVEAPTAGTTHLGQQVFPARKHHEIPTPPPLISHLTLLLPQRTR